MRPHERSGTPLLCGVADGLLVFFPALELARTLRLPPLGASAEFMSASARAGFEPLTNYAQLALCALLVFGAFWLGYRRRQPLIAWVPAWVAERVSARRSLEGVVWAVATVAVLVYLINVTAVNVDAPLVDGFHEGEYLGFVPAIGAGGSVIDSVFTVHGPGVDLLPGWLAGKAASSDHGIVTTRLAYASLRMVAALAALLVTLVFVRLLAPASSRARWLAGTLLSFMILAVGLQIGGWAEVPAFHKTPNARDTAYLVLVLVALLHVHAQRSGRGALAIVFAAIAGGLAPWALAYSYDRGLYGGAFLLFASIALAIAGGRWARDWFGGLAVGAAAGTALLYAAFGTGGVGAIVEQIAFWVRYDRTIWAYVGLDVSADSLGGMLLGGALISIAIASAQVGGAIIGAARLGDAVRTKIAIIVMLAASLPPLRTAVERGDIGHVAWGVTVAWIMLASFAADYAVRTLAPELSRADEPGTPRDGVPAWPLVAAIISAVVGANLVFLDPVAAYAQVHDRYLARLRTTDSMLVSPGQQRTASVLRRELAGSPCFYTLTNEGTWYYLVGKPSCSRFYQMTNARPARAAAEVVAALEKTAPPVVLFASGNKPLAVDGVSSFDTNPEIMRYILRRYRPAAAVDGDWIWRRAEDPLRFSDRRVGTIASAPAVATRTNDALVTGTFDGSPLDAVAYFVTAGDDRVPIWAGRPDPVEARDGRWSAVVPTAALSPGRYRVRVWAFVDPATPMLQLGSDATLELR